jgi:protein BCP1
MAKRKAPSTAAPPRNHARPTSKDDSDAEMHSDNDSGSDTSILDVSFEFFDPQPPQDYAGLKSLLRQLLDADAPLIDLGGIVDAILRRRLVGSTIKADEMGNEGDPWAFMTVLGLNPGWAEQGVGAKNEGAGEADVQREGKALEGLRGYLHQRALSGGVGMAKVADILDAAGREDGGVRLGLLLSERLINIPAEVVPPMWKMLGEEIAWAVDEGEAEYGFTHFLLLSKRYREVASALDAIDRGEDESEAPTSSRPSKRSKKAARKGAAAEKGQGAEGELFFFHPEDELLQRCALCQGGFAYVNELGEGGSDAKRTFQDLGIKPEGMVMVLEAGRYGEVVEGLEAFLKP